MKMHFKLCDKFNLAIIFLLYTVTSVTTQDNITITIPLNNTITYDNREIYGNFIELNHSSTVEVRFTSINTNLSFILIQVHTQFQNVTLYNNHPNKSEVIGTNIGLISVLEKLPSNKVKADIFFIQNPDDNINMQAYISVHGYTQGDPFPGGCNAEWNPIQNKIVPFVKTRSTSATIIVEAAPPSIDPDCNLVNGADVTFYMMYTSERNFNADVYFAGIRKMMSLKNIENYGIEIPITTASAMRRILSAYPGTGVVFVAVAQNQVQNLSAYAVYVPTFTYSCPDVDENGCKTSGEVVFRLLCTILLFVGLFVSFLGHRFFKTEMFLAGFFSGFLLTYIFINLIEIHIGTQALVAASLLSGVFFGAIWLLFWWLYGIPVVAVLLPSLNAGFIFASIFYYRLPATVLYMHEDFQFWTVFIIINAVLALIMAFVAYSANILCCSFLGGFCVMYAFDYFLGSNLKYIVANTVRRAVIPDFRLAVLKPPFLSRDLFVTLLWILVTMMGWVFQHWHNRGRPPFPPPPRSTRLAAPGPTMYGAVTDFTRRLFPRNRFSGSPVLPAMNRTNEQTALLSDGNNQI